MNLLRMMYEEYTTWHKGMKSPNTGPTTIPRENLLNGLMINIDGISIDCLDEFIWQVRQEWINTAARFGIDVHDNTRNIVLFGSTY